MESTTKELAGATHEVPSTALERWLGSVWRRQILVFTGVLLLAVVSTQLWVNAASSVGREVDWNFIFGRRLIDWGLWGVLVEPLIWIARASSRWGRYWVLIVALHLPLSFVVAMGMTEVRVRVTDSLLPPPAFERGGRGERGGPGRRGSPAASAERGDAARPRPDGRRSRRPEQMWDRFRRSRADFGVLAYWALLGLGFGIHTFLQTRQQERRSVQLELRTGLLERELVEAQLDNLKSQLHPHFLFNALHSVGGLIRDDRSQAALTALANLGSLLRGMLDIGESQEVPLRDELELVEGYLDIERLRFGDRLDATTRVEPGLGATRVPALLLLPLIENAVKHGVAPRPEGGEIVITISREGERVCVEVLDDGPGFPSAAEGADPDSSDHTPIGLENTRSRLAALYGDAASLETSNRSGGGARVSLWVPLIPSSDEDHG